MQDEQTLNGLVALITGSSRGIGAATARLFAASGAAVMLSGRDREALEAVRREIAQDGGAVSFVEADLSDPSAPAELVRRTAENFGGLDILVNNAGITLSQSIESTSTTEWDRVMAINCRAPFLAAQAAIPLLRVSSRAAIVNISSVVGRKGYPMQGAYTASKHALVGLSKVLAKELQDEGIGVFTVAPGGAATEMISRVRPDINQDELIDPVQIARTILFLLTMEGNAAVDEINIRRESKTPWE